jgi:hypothetical protein
MPGAGAEGYAGAGINQGDLIARAHQIGGDRDGDRPFRVEVGGG